MKHSQDERYGAVEFDNEGRAISIEEKPRRPNPIGSSQSYTSMRRSSNPRPAASWKLLMSTGPVWRWGSCRSS
ncbi:sugar phosphate nucleotidyltransferase [Microvirga tunisiensis]|uniref:sugar phosphate nucleotidyltransferase n=1 Tax=Microvirga tunisiensis TaxID=2108360 RepID=UPI003B84612B